ncbi:Cobalt-precorrin-2 C(20)-methyltransferase [Fusobacterium sp. DD29]|uniref:precorrin-2 C(20)-methyltransferase n=1 Tax=unclassified Fusobacterium TaxID=2648384 RepID=UPI001B8CB846|nr:MULTISPECIES: precorrin-2 C(20)-methyltransferase [unclassified Fusobacterium]MBR8701075.1 Cobalt-precorrin-2 C(20)-methyltransferase [Fusobacterium sp. DD45]MBR8710881.1 Cobalt-precorrin-2 C(20)-methyltransferase [Fusobacterium sp. DD28]MBR8749093.1 Cobalt-precorrin-2 C(20)-methyltransferase [Fusobacterium sp. DD29]MBR8751443.1 Cobalt-precorrin-2 C(20)-methyltransferase [Fusobacterium sp. DD26]MBR8761359.1 Cobalt-precorrin-2 C(20)-methyltransferase [Fusobacterium sp. DD25]
MSNKFYGIGVGVGDPEQLTVKAINILKKLDVVIVPEAKKDEGSTAYEISKEYLKPGVDLVFMEFPMLKNPLDRVEGRKANTRVVEKLLDEGKNVGFLTIGDSMTYSTYVYILENLQDKYKKQVETVPGISSFADMSSRFNFPIVMGDESLKIVSINENTDIEKELNDTDNIVFMKVSRNFDKLKEALAKTGNMNNVIMVSNSGKDTEKVFYDISNLTKEDIPYFTTMIFKKGGFEEWKKFSL